MKIKICGITKPEETRYLIENDVDFAGIVMFFEKSKRNVDQTVAAEIIKSFREASADRTEADRIKIVAVVVSPSAEQIEVLSDLGFDYVQIHGELTEQLIDACKLPILKAFNVSDMDKYDFYCGFEKIVGFVFDAGEPGSGKTFDWNMLGTLERKENKLFILAGGLNSVNVANAINVVNPDGVDVSSAVEICEELPGKDPLKIIEFVRAVRG